MTEEGLLTKEELLAEEHICNGKCQDDITKNYVHCRTCTRIKDFLAGYKTGFETCAKARLNVTTISDYPIIDDLKQDLEHKKIAIRSRNARIKKLEKENAGLRARLNAINLLTPELQKMSQLKTQQLTKAKEILRGLYFIIQNRIDYENNTGIADEMWRAKQFLSEVGE